MLFVVYHYSPPSTKFDSAETIKEQKEKIKRKQVLPAIEWAHMRKRALLIVNTVS